MNGKWAVLIPTKNRPLFVRRQLNFYASFHRDIHVYIGDSSDIADPPNYCPLVYDHLPGMNELEATLHMAQQAHEPYLAFCGDDDFLWPPALDDFATTLETDVHDDAVSGTCIQFALWDDLYYGKVEAAFEYPDMLFRLYRRFFLRGALAHALHEARASLRGATMYDYLERHARTFQAPEIHLFRQGHDQRVTADGHKSWRTQFGRDFRSLVRLNQWLQSFTSLNLPALRRSSPEWQRVESFLRHPIPCSKSVNTATV